MTSMASESAITILCTCKQTRFNIGTPNYRELDIEGLNISITAGAKSGVKGKEKGKNASIEILNNAKLRLKAGQQYALVGRNGTGKSTLLKAISEKLIPGIPEETRVVLLQQTNIADANTDETGAEFPPPKPKESRGSTVLEEVIERATSRHKVQEEIRILTSAMNSTSTYGALRGARRVKHERLQKELFLKDKDARLRSGARGTQARKVLIAMEKEVAAFQATYEEKDEDISPDKLVQETSEAADMLAELELQVEPSKLAETESRGKRILTGLGFSETCMQKPISSLSGGWRMRTALSTALLQKTDILILDEPTNFLDILGIMWLQRHLMSVAEGPNPPTLILVSHDRDFMSLCTDLLIIKDKDLTYFHGDLAMYESSRAEKKVYLTKMKEAKDEQEKHIQQTIARNMKDGKFKDDQNKIRQAKSRQKKLDDRWGMEVSAKGGRFKLNRDLPGYHFTNRGEIEIPQDEKAISFALPRTTELRFPGALLALEKVSFRYPAVKKTTTPNPLVLQDINLSVHMGDRIGILGLNGGGKSTLIKLLVGEAKPTSGTLTTHPRLKSGYYSQNAVQSLQQMGVAEPYLTSLTLLTREVAGALNEGELRGLLASFGLPGRLASDVPIRKLSGGQLVRLEMTRLLWKCPHCLVLDESTTHLDYETVLAMREALHAWEGAVVVVSHDRWFMRGVVAGLVEDEYSDMSNCEDKVERRRMVYKLSKGQMTVLQGGAQEFEDSMEKRVRKLVNS
ncbi:ABC transporter [Pseudomassariella vexata]|uniref:ABC transporter n=1 Tax=Pseudomassariella vexata TaxID=1141098 RepID=A0A1Y2DUJ7_9PEZI|nr:ABC transporter [Pseudomassariella vexata]ORY62917.1 ABC transporter [Pseudomassariella vexata]